ncbi:MAG: hypothetical protein KBT88_05390 [Gammaproteobacteria bacterium]|nr:hypothetical protein [Gammaproteobacteria bacterium]
MVFIGTAIDKAIRIEDMAVNFVRGGVVPATTYTQPGFIGVKAICAHFNLSLLSGVGFFGGVVGRVCDGAKAVQSGWRVCNDVNVLVVNHKMTIVIVIALIG